MEKFWNNEELEVIETLEPFPLSEKVQILKDSILEESNLDNLKILKSVLDGFHSLRRRLPWRTTKSWTILPKRC